MDGILDKVGAWIGFVVFLLPAGTLWGFTLIGIAVMTARALWRGRRQKPRRKEFKP